MRVTFHVGLVLALLSLSARAGDDCVDRALVAVLTAEGPATAEVNALLALGPDLVKPRLRELLLASNVRASTAGRRRMAIETLAAILGGKPGREVRGITRGSEYFVLDGYVFRRFQALGMYFGSPPEWQWKPTPPLEEIMGGADAWREPLVPDPEALLAHVLDPDPENPSSRAARGNAALPLGDAAANDPVLFRKILDALKVRSREDPGWGTLVGAAGRSGRVEALEWFRSRVAEVLTTGRGQDASNRIRTIVEGMRLYGGEALLTAEADRWREVGPDPWFAFALAAGGNAGCRYWLAHARPAPTAENLWARYGGSRLHPPPDPDLIFEVLAIAERALASEDTHVRSAAGQLVSDHLWPCAVSRGLFGFSGDVPTEGTVSRAGGGIGAFPDAAVQWSRLKEDLAAGRIRLERWSMRYDRPLDPILSHRWEGEACFQQEWEGERPDWAGEPGYYESLRFGAKRRGAEVEVRIANPGDRALSVNPLVFRYGCASRYTETTKLADGRIRRREQFDLDLGAPMSPYLRIARPQDLRVVPPGGEITFRYPLPGNLVEDAVIVVRVRDDFALDGPAPAPRLLDLPNLRVESSGIRIRDRMGGGRGDSSFDRL